MYLDELDLDSAPADIDDGIARLATGWRDGDPMTQLTFATLCWIRYVQSALRAGRPSAPDDLDRSIGAYGRAVSALRADEHVVPEALAEILLTYANVVHTRHSVTGSAADLDRSIDLTDEAVQLAGQPADPNALGAMSDRHIDRYRTRGRADDYAAAERALLTALAMPGVGPVERASIWLRLGHVYEARFAVTNEPADRNRYEAALATGWREGAGYPLLGMAYVDASINGSGGPDAALRTLAEIDVTDLPPDMQPSFHYYAMVAHFRRHVPGELDDLGSAGAAATRLIDHPHTEPGLRAEARVVRATARLDHFSITRDMMGDIDPVIDDLEQIGDQVGPAQRQYVDTQLARVLTERARRTSDPADVDRAAAFADAALGRLPAGTPNRTEICYYLGFLLMAKVEAGRADPAALDRAIELLRAAVKGRAGMRAAAAAQLGAALISRLFYLGRGAPGDLDVAIGHLDLALRTGALDDANRFAVAAGLAQALMVRFELRGDLADLQWCRDLLNDVRDEAPTDPNRHELLLGLAQVELAHSAAVGAAPDAAALRAVEAALARIRPGDMARVQALRTLAGGYGTRAVTTGDPDDWRAAVRHAESVLSEVPADSPLAPLFRLTACGVLALAGRDRDDATLTRRAVDILAGLAGDPAQPMRERYLGVFAMALLDLHRQAPDPGLLARALPALAEAAATAEAQPGARGAAEIVTGYSAALAAAGDLPGAIRAGGSALRMHAWQVLLQSGTHEAMTAARQSADTALQLARVHLRAEDPRGACLALETGRGLVLHAATVAATVPELLRRANRSDLADEWTAQAGAASSDWRTGAPTAPNDLRFRVLTVLRRESALFEPPSVEALAEALRAVAADALVYLFPGAGAQAGLALVVGADARVVPVELPGLTDTWSAPSSAPARDWGPAASAQPMGRTLADDCAEAWDVAIGPLLDSWPGSDPHFVLVPGGTLAAVPWHAAHNHDGRWAIDEAEFSYIASGRLLVDVAGRKAAAAGGGSPAGAVVIGNPDTGRPADDLPGAGAEASTIFHRHYATGRYCGRPADPSVPVSGPGTPQDVIGWLTGGAPVLHLACHGVIDAAGPSSSRLILAGGTTVSAEEILRTAAARPGRRSPGVVTLAACTTHRAGRSYDEAVTLSTAFLVAGAATAIGSLWPVPDDGTARLMMAFHDNLAGRGMPPRRALREAQRAMREPGDPKLAQWAGFVHLGR